MAPVDTKLDQILNAPEHQLRTALRLACTADRDTRDRVWKCLSDVTAFEQQPARMMKRKAGDDELADESKRTKLLEDLHHCINCKQTFLGSENQDGICFYHSDKPEPNEDHDFWADTDDWEHIDAYSLLEGNPEAFWFPCCEQGVESKGCHNGRHQAADEEKRKVSFPITVNPVVEAATGTNKDAVIEISDDDGSEGDDDDNEEDE